MSNEENKSTDAKVFESLVQQSYSQTDEGLQNPTEAVEFKTSRELQYVFRESCEPTVAEISRSMMDLKFKGLSKENAYYWKLYKRLPDPE